MGNSGKVKAMDRVRMRLREKIRHRFAVGNRWKVRVPGTVSFRVIASVWMTAGDRLRTSFTATCSERQDYIGRPKQGHNEG